MCSMIPRCSFKGIVQEILTKVKTFVIYVLFIHNCLCVLSPRPHIPVFPPDLFLYVNLVAKGAQKLLKSLAPPAYSIGYPLLSLMHLVAQFVL